MLFVQFHIHTRYYCLQYISNFWSLMKINSNKAEYLWFKGEDTIRNDHTRLPVKQSTTFQVPRFIHICSLDEKIQYPI